MGHIADSLVLCNSFLDLFPSLEVQDFISLADVDSDENTARHVAIQFYTALTIEFENICKHV